MTSMTPQGAAPLSVSVVIPFFRDEVYLEDAVRSAVGQPIDDLEIIVVNDNPNPETDAFLAELAARLPIRVARHERNCGLAAARNTGIELAKRDFVAFLDADDVFTQGGLADNLAIAVRTGSDITHAPTLLLPVDGMHSQPFRRDALLFSREKLNATLASAPEAQFIASSWCSLYSRAFLNGRHVRFDEAQRRYEDRLFVLEAVTKAKTISFGSRPARIWRRRLGSITTSAKPPADMAMQCDLIVKCVGLAKRYAAESGASMFLQRELLVSTGRLVWDVDFFACDPARTPDLDATRAALTSAFAGLSLSKRAFADGIVMPISRIGAKTPGRRPVSRADMRKIFADVRAGRWAELHAWRRSLDIAPRYWRRSRPSPLDAELILHVGLHKTGSTHLQRVLEQDHDRLRENGILFPKTGFVASVGDNVREAATPGHAALYGALRKRDLAHFETLREEVVASGCSRVVISSENMSLPLDEDGERRAFYAAAREAMSIFPKIRIVALVRRPDEYVERYYRELVFLARHWSRRTPEQFAFEVSPALTDIGALLGEWKEIAGGRLRLIGYDHAKAVGLEAAFYAELGLAPPETRRRGATYPTPGADQTAIARVIANSALAPELRTRALGLFLRDSVDLASVRDGSLLSLATRRALIHRFASTSNAFLAAHDAPPPVEDWLSDLDRCGDESPAERRLDPRLLQCALSAMERAVTTKAAQVTPPPWLRLYRLGRRTVSRFR